MKRIALATGLSLALAGPALAHDGRRCASEAPPQTTYAEPTNAVEGLDLAMDLVQQSMDFALGLSERVGVTGLDRAELDQAMASLDSVFALLGAMDGWADPQPTARKGKGKGKAGKKGTGSPRNTTVRARR